MENNIERNEDNGRGMFYAIIGIATLVVTIIGATFAYLTATTNSEVNAITAGGATITLGYTDNKIGLKENLIPIDTDLTQFAKGTFTGTGFKLLSNGDYELDSDGEKQEVASVTYNFAGITKNDCRDVNGNNICSVYEFTISNPSTNTVSQYVYASFEVGVNTFNNLYFAVFKGNDSQIRNKSGYTLKTGDTAITTKATVFDSFTTNANDATRKHVIGDNGDLVVAKTKIDTKATAGGTAVKFNLNNQLDQYLDVGESKTYTIILWVDETNSDQDDDGKSFTGTVRFTTEGNSTGVTGDLDANS